MPIPSEYEILIPLLHFVNASGGRIKPSDAYHTLATSFGLTKKERDIYQPSGLNNKFNNRVAWARFILCSRGLLNGATRGVWTITDKGCAELARLGLSGKPFTAETISINKDSLPDSAVVGPPKLLDDNLLDLILEEIAPKGLRKFPDDFLDHLVCTEYYDVTLPGTEIRLAPLSETIITSLRGYFRYQAKNPAEAKFILYCFDIGIKNIKIPNNTLVMFKAVKSYERYCDDLAKLAFELFIDFTNDESKAEELTSKAIQKLCLKAKLRGS